ncbi:MAG: hypothetical protein IPH03_02660 [Tetrasphaera sp.]|jgi:hypothetical protein|nr:hypothetical protein [Tetrasphaera sp.]
MPLSLKPAASVITAPLVVLGLAGGYLIARETGVRPMGGFLLGAAGLVAGRTWLARGGPVEAGGLGALYLLAFGVSHPLAKQIGAWPSVAVVTAVAAGAAYAVSDRRAIAKSE